MPSPSLPRSSPRSSTPSAVPVLLLAVPWLPALVAAPALLLLPALAAVAAIFAGWSVSFLVLSRIGDQRALCARLAVVAAVVAAGLLALQVLR